MKNQTIALLIGIFIVVSLASFLIVPKNIVYITGKASSGSSNTAFNLTEEVSVLVTNAVDFGEGRVDANASYAILDSEGGGGSAIGWANITGMINSPATHEFLATVYDPALDVFIAYGGDIYDPDTDSYSPDTETWMFNYSNKEWTNLTATAGAPKAIYSFGMVYDNSARGIIMCGGEYDFFQENQSNETWKFNSSMRWENLSPSNTPPFISDWDPAMAFDSKRNVTVMFGGYENWGVAYMNETWEYNSSSNSWTNKTKAITPPARTDAFMAFDSERNVTVLIGGAGSYSSTSQDVFEYTGTDWINVTASTGYAPANPLGLSYDAYRKNIVFVADYDTWTYNGTGFVNVSAPWIGALAWQLMSYDSSAQKTLFVYPDNTWAYPSSISGGGGGGCINGTWSFSPSFIYVENDGTVDINVNYTANKNAGQFIGGTSPSFKIKGVVDESGACADLNTTYAEVSNSTETPLTLCPVLKYQNDADRIKVPARLVVPSDVASGVHNSTVTFSATLV